MDIMRTLALPKEVKHWSLTTLREKLVKIGAKVVRHGRYVTLSIGQMCLWIQPPDNYRAIRNDAEKLFLWRCRLGSITMNLKAIWEISAKDSKTVCMNMGAMRAYSKGECSKLI